METARNPDSGIAQVGLRLSKPNDVPSPSAKKIYHRHRRHDHHGRHQYALSVSVRPLSSALTRSLGIRQRHHYECPGKIHLIAALTHSLGIRQRYAFFFDDAPAFVMFRPESGFCGARFQICCCCVGKARRCCCFCCWTT